MAVRKFLDDSGAAQLNAILAAKFNEKQDNMVILSYGHSTWQDFLDAYNKNGVVYCRASSSSDPGSGSQTRLAFMAYVNNAENPTNVEFQYYRSVSSHSDSQQGDQVYVYTLKNTGVWSVTVRNAFSKIVPGTNMSSSYASGAITLNATDTTYESKTAASGGTDVSLVTTGEKYIWNNKSNFSGYYNDLTDKPSINNVTLSGNKTSNDLSLQTKMATDLTADLYLVDGTTPTLSEGKYFTNVHKVYVNGTEFTAFNNCIFDYGYDDEEDIHIFIKSNETGFARIDYYDGQYSVYISSPLLRSQIDTTIPVTPRNTKVPSTKLLNDQLALKGTYSKPSGGIPKTDLASAVQTSLGLADTALQSYTETDPTVPAAVKAITSTDISNWNNKSDFSGDYTDLTNKPQINGITLTGDQTASDLGIKIKNIDVLNLVDGAAMPSELDFEGGKPKLYLIANFRHNGTEVNTKLNQSLWLGYKVSTSNDYYLQFIQGRNNSASGRYENYRFYTYYNPNNTENPYCSWTLESDNHISYSTTDLTAGTSALATGSLYFVYE